MPESSSVPELNLPRPLQFPSKQPAAMTLDQLEASEKTIREGQRTFVVVAEELMKIKALRGYKLRGFQSFEEYCTQHLGFTRQRAYQLIEAAGIAADPNVNNLLTIENESQARAVKQVGIENLQQAAAELAPPEPQYEPCEDAQEEAPEPPKAKRSPVQAARDLIKKAKAIKEKQKEERRAARREEIKAGGTAFAGQAAVGIVTVHCLDSRQLHTVVAPGSVQLVVTSPPYNVGKKYNTHDDTLSPSEYAALLQAVFSECFAALCDGGRIAVVVPFGVGRSPWVPVAPVVTDHLCAVGFTLRGWITWHKGTLTTSTAWGSYRSPSNPVLRDTNEAIIIGQKGSDKLDIPPQIFVGDEVGIHSPWLKEKEDFLRLVTDFWSVRPENAERVGHPTPFPVEIPERLIRLYGYPGCLVVDCFAGSGSTGVAAQRLGARAVLADIDPGYCALAEGRLKDD